MEQEKREKLIEKINKEYNEAEKYITDSITAWAGAMRRALIETVKLVYIEKMGEDSWKGQKLVDALNDEQFKSFFPEKSTTTIEDMHKIRKIRNLIEYQDEGAEEITLPWRERYLKRLSECIEDVSNLLGVKIIIIPKAEQSPSPQKKTPQNIQPLNNFSRIHPVQQSKSREKVKHSRFGEGEIISIKNDIVKVVFGGINIKEFSYPSSFNNGILTRIKISTSQPTVNTPSIQATTSSQKHRWTYDEDRTCCRIFIETYIINRTYCPFDTLATKILTIYPNMKFSSVKMKLQNIKRICLDYGVKDSSTISPLNNYSAQNLRAMKESLQEIGITI